MAQNTEGAPSTGHAAASGLTVRQRRMVRRTTWVVSLIALAVYIGFIVLTVTRAHH